MQQLLRTMPLGQNHSDHQVGSVCFNDEGLRGVRVEQYGSSGKSKFKLVKGLLGLRKLEKLGGFLEQGSKRGDPLRELQHELPIEVHKSQEALQFTNILWCHPPEDCLYPAWVHFNTSRKWDESQELSRGLIEGTFFQFSTDTMLAQPLQDRIDMYGVLLGIV